MARGDRNGGRLRLMAGPLPESGAPSPWCTEALVAQPREDPALDHQDARFDLGLVARLARPIRRDTPPRKASAWT
jgi:hypothetical protein